MKSGQFQAQTQSSLFVINRYRWLEAERLAGTLGVPLLVAQVLAGRGLSDPQAAKDFLEHHHILPDPFLFGHMADTVQTISRALDQASRIVIHGDYDTDGITATALLLVGLRCLGAQPEWYLPSRFNEGYGLSAQAVQRIAAGGSGLLITVDCGVNYPEEVALARASGLEVIVIDHHQPGARLPECCLIHPAVGSYPHGDLCGVGLALKVLHALHVKRLGASPSELPSSLKDELDLVALGTIADLAPLRGENRWYVHEGLKLLSLGKRLGLRMLASLAGCAGAIDSAAVSYRLAPRLNAAGRLADPSPPLKLLLCEDEKEAAVLANQLHELNGARQDVERQVLEEALAQVEALSELPPILVLAGEGWHEGVVGIVASRLVERYSRPAVLLGVRDGIAKGSGRSVPAYDLLKGLRAADEFLSVYGGHAQAVGLTLAAKHIDHLRHVLENHASQTLDPRDLMPVYRVDAVIRGIDLNTDTAEALAALAPFGVGNPRPRLLAVDALIHSAEPTRDGAHLQMRVGVDGVKVRGVGFRLGDRACQLEASKQRWSLGVQLQVDEWQGTVRPQLLIQETSPLGECAFSLGRCGDACPRLSTEVPGSGERVCFAEAPGDAQRLVASLRGLAALRDLRDQPGVASGIAQILATSERTLLLASSIGRRVVELERRLPLAALVEHEPACVGRGCMYDRHRLMETRTVFADWEALGSLSCTTMAWDHVIALEPPFRGWQISALLSAAKRGSIIHLCYGKEERCATLDFLRHVVHPRFAMVCLYKAMKEGDLDQHTLFARALSIAWQQAKVVLTVCELERAWMILAALGLERPVKVRAKLEAREVPAYVAAEEDYKECRKLCLSL